MPSGQQKRRKMQQAPSEDESMHKHEIPARSHLNTSGLRMAKKEPRTSVAAEPIKKAKDGYQTEVHEPSKRPRRNKSYRHESSDDDFQYSKLSQRRQQNQGTQKSRHRESPTPATNVKHQIA